MDPAERAVKIACFFPSLRTVIRPGIFLTNHGVVFRMSLFMNGVQGSEVQRFRVQRFRVQRFRVQRFRVHRLSGWDYGLR